MSAGLALLASLLWGASDFLGGSLSRRLSTVVVMAISQTLAASLLLAYVVHTEHWVALGIDEVVTGIAAGVCWMIGLAAFYRALAIGHMGVVAPVGSVGVVLPVVVGMLCGDRPGALQIVGLVVAIAGVVFCAGPERRAAESGRSSAALLLALLAAGCFGTEITLLDGLSKAGDREASLLVVRVTAACLVLGAAAVLGRRGGLERPPRGRHALPGTPGWVMTAVVALGVLDLAAMAAYTAACSTGALSLVAVLASLYPAVTVLLARGLQQERLRSVQKWGVIATLGGAALIAG